MDFLKAWLAQHPEFRQLVDFYQENLTLVDFIIVIFGSFLLFFQASLFVFNGKRAYFRKAQKRPLYTKKQMIYLSYISGSIEVLPFLGIFGTIIGLMRALQTLRLESHPTITVMATAIAPALSTTLMGLIFAILNLFFFNILKAYFEELHVRFNLAFNDYASKTLLTMAHFLQPEEKEKLRLILDIPSEARIYDDSVLKLIERVRKQAEEDLKLPSPQPPPVAPPQKKSIVKETSSLKKGGGLA